MNEKNIEMLKARLKTLGFSDNADSLLRCHTCFAPEEFDIRFEKQAGADHCSYLVHFIRGEKGSYDCVYYLATLRKPVEMPATLKQYETAMGSINWREIAAIREGWVTEGVSPDNAARAGEVLGAMTSSPEAESLKYAHWAGTTLESLLPNLSQLKMTYEISQRFYFTEEQEPISADEAVRFLQSRWLEKRTLVQQKLLLKKKKDEGRNAERPRLLLKKPRKGQGDKLI